MVLDAEWFLKVNIDYESVQFVLTLSRTRNMKLAISALGVLSLFLAAGLAPSALAAPSTNCSNDPVSSGYAATSNFHGTTVPIGTPVTVYACTTDTTITQVLFIWHRPDSSVAFQDFSITFTTVTDGSGVSARQFTDTQTPNVLGDWGVQTVFCTGTDESLDNCNVGKGVSTETVDIKATSFLVASVVPVLGAALIGATMFGALLLYRRAGGQRNPVKSNLA